MIFDTNPLSDIETQRFIYYNNIGLNFAVAKRLKISIPSYSHAFFLKSVAKGGKDDR